MAAIPSERASAGVMCGTARPATASVPASGCSAPVMILISVDLPAPFSPTSACTSPASQVERHAAQRADAFERLGDGGRGEQDAGQGGRMIAEFRGASRLPSVIAR